MKVLKWIAGSIAVLALAIGLTFVGAKFHDGPLGMIPGGPLESGDIVPHLIVGWDHMASAETIELQLDGEDTSRTTWFIVYKTYGYIPASHGFPPGKTWHLRADENGSAIIRIDGKRYEVELQRTSDEGILRELRRHVKKKYGSPPPSDSETWFFKVQSTAPMPNFTM